jgi:putative transposase
VAQEAVEPIADSFGQGSQFNGMVWASLLRAHNLAHSMNRRGNCHDNAVAESFFNLLKRERVRRRTYKTRVEARRDVFDYIEMFYNLTRKHARNGMLSPADFERQPEMWTAPGLADNSLPHAAALSNASGLTPPR